MFKIPLRFHDTATFSEHGIRFGCVQGFYLAMDGTNAVHEATSDSDNTDDDETSEYETSEYETTSESESD